MKGEKKFGLETNEDKIKRIRGLILEYNNLREEISRLDEVISEESIRKAVRVLEFEKRDKEKKLEEVKQKLRKEDRGLLEKEDFDVSELEDEESKGE